MSKHWFGIVVFVMCIANIASNNVMNAFAADGIAAVKSYPSEKEFRVDFDTPEFVDAKLPKGYVVRNDETTNGSAALFFERTDPDEYILYSFPVPDLVAGRRYVLHAKIKTQDLKRHADGGNFSALCVEHYKGDHYHGGQYGTYDPDLTDWHPIRLPFVAPQDAASTVTLYLSKKNTGKIWFDDVVVSADELAIVLTKPDRLSFFGNSGRFVFRVENSLPKNVKMIATIKNGGKTKKWNRCRGYYLLI